MKRHLRLTGAAVCAALALYFLLPLFCGVCHIGMFYPAAFFLLLAAVLCFPKRFAGLFRGRSRPWAIAAAAVLSAGTAAVLAVLIAMGAAAANGPTAELAPKTVVVLGCQVIDERPSLMLQRRIDAAYGYLAAHPEAVCVASGGMDDDEIITEAACIRDELVRRGIAPERIYLEEQSRSTAENLSCTARVAADEGLDPTVAIASDNFHQLRAAYYARRAGLTPCALGCRSPWYLSGGYWMREVPGMAAAWVRGY